MTKSFENVRAPARAHPPRALRSRPPFWTYHRSVSGQNSASWGWNRSCVACI